MHKELGKLSDQVTAGEVCFRFGVIFLPLFVGEYNIHIRGLFDMAFYFRMDIERRRKDCRRRWLL